MLDVGFRIPIMGKSVGGMVRYIYVFVYLYIYIYTQYIVSTVDYWPECLM